MIAVEELGEQLYCLDEEIEIYGQRGEKPWAQLSVQFVSCKNETDIDGLNLPGSTICKP